MIQHSRTTASSAVYSRPDQDGRKRDVSDVRGRVAHESLFNTNDGRYRCPSTQQGYSPFTTWTRGLAWIMVGYAEQLEFIASLADGELEPFRPGFASVARRAGAAILPTALEGAYRAWPRWRTLPRLGTVHVKYGPPILPEQLEGYDGAELVAEVGGRIRRLQTELRRHPALGGRSARWIQCRPVQDVELH